MYTHSAEVIKQLLHVDFKLSSDEEVVKSVKSMNVNVNMT